MSEKLPNRKIAKTRQPYNNHQYPIYYYIAKFQKCRKYCYSLSMGTCTIQIFST